MPTTNLTQNVPQLVLSTNASNAQQTQQTQQQTVPRLITNIAAIQPQQQSANHVQIRPVLTAVPQGGQLTLIQRPGQQAQLAQIVQPQTIQKTIITRPQVVQVQQQTATQQTQQVATQTATGTTIKVSAAGANATGQRRGLSLSVSFLYKIYFIQL